MRDRRSENRAEERSLNIAGISRELLAELSLESACDIPDMQQAMLRAQKPECMHKVSSMEYEMACMRRSEIVYEPKITAFHSKTARLIVTVKKVICKLCKFWGEPLTDQINVYHDHVYNALCLASERLNQLEQENRELMQQMEDLREQLRTSKEKP